MEGNYDKKEKIILICAIAACAVALIVGITVGCVSCSNQGKKHNWDWDWDADGHWQYCIDDGCDEKTEKKPHVDTDSDEKCDECGASLKKEEPTPPTPQPPVEETETATIYFHKPADFGDKVYAHAYYRDSESDPDKNLTGDWKTYEVTTVEDDWYTIEIKHPKGLLEDGSFNLMIVPEEGSSINVTINAAEMWVNANGNLFASKEEALADEALEKVEYAIYYYAPDWADGEKVYVYTYNGPSVGGEYNTEMNADGEDGWYKITFKTTQTFTSFNIIFHTEDESTKHEFGISVTEELLVGKAFYFVDNGEGVYANKAEAEEAYTNPVEEPEYTETATIHFHKPVDFGDKVYAHAYYSNGTSDKNLTGAWMSYEVTTIVDGWYTIIVKHPDNLFETSSFNLMIIPEEGDSISVTINAAEMWVNANGNLFATKAEALADEEAEKTEYTIYVYAPDWTDGEAVYIHTYGDIVFTNYETTTMTADTNGWYKISFETTLQLSEFHYMLHTADEVIKTDTYVSLEGLEGTNIYVIYTTASDGSYYATKEAAEAAYRNTPVKPVDPVEKQTVTIYYHGTGEISVHAYYYTSATTTVDITEWNTKPSMTADTVNAGWLKVDLEIPANIFDDYTNFTAMIVGAAGGDKYVTISAAETWISAKGNPFATKAEAEADDHVHNFGNSYVCEKDGVADPTYHWQVCSTCGEESTKELHNYEGDSNVCTKCGYEKPTASHEHIWSEEYDTSVAGYHTQTCTVEGCTETKPAPHQFEKLSHVCTVCGHNEDEGLVRIYVNINTVGFTSPTGKYYIYAWGAAGGDGVDGNSVLGGWPGLELDYDEGDGWYSGAIAINPNYLNGGHPQINSDNGDDDRWNCDFMLSGLSDDVTEYFFDRATACSTTNPYNLEQVTFRINVDKSQLTAGSTYYIYAHYNASDSIFGGWNDSELTKENPADETDNWYTITINISKTYTGTCNIMVHTEVAGQQYDAMTITTTNGNWSSNSPDMVITKVNA